MSFWRKAALSSKPIFASAAMSVPWSSSARGFTSTMVQSQLLKTSYKDAICFFAASLSPETPRPATIASALASVRPATTSMGTLMIFSGDDSARSSMDVPPSAHATTTGPPNARSRRMAKYISLTRFIFSATMTTLTGLPSAPDCLVTSVAPIIFSAYSAVFALSMTCTPPWKPFVNVPRPRPPARICDLMTTSSPPSSLAAATASA
mmetsp:Transcript_34497/g.116966  ORF Transcript_34497/g.116966 Transcript_34497/m.116966 type:complete len:207 (+) Transcript_34497:568-1188(+)